MFRALLRLFRGSERVPPEPRLLVEARAKAQASEPSTLLVLVEASYLPHGGRDRLLLELTAQEGGHVERVRTRERREPERVQRELPSAEARRLLNELDGTIWTLADERAHVLDGLAVEFACVRGTRVHSAQLRGGDGRDSPLERLLSSLLELAPLAGAL